ncbi:UNC93-like protein 6 [Colletotrichum chlorophyti]|uniref:UNC93-like protein 6 n=1 Tax=Colletotrichum chlorophyti TaxID=708187 RepID=A0A1Q8RBY3_9PEZI|nr:UNC93-like protein 6 [Colletotrichum chlorophyti]
MYAYVYTNASFSMNLAWEATSTALLSGSFGIIGFTNGGEAAAENPHDAALELRSENIPKRTWYRTVFFQATVIGLCAFFAPGLYNAMQSTGAGGQQTPYLVMSASAVLGLIMVVTCSLSSVVANRIGLKNALIFGTTGYGLCSATLYTNNPYGTEWFVYVGSTACGITAGIFWAAEGAIMISYPEDHNRGRYLAYWLAFRNGGLIVGGAINLALNSTGKSTGKLDWRTYIVFVTLQCLGPFIALLLSPPEKVQRQDGRPVEKAEKIPTVAKLKAVAKILIRKDFLLVYAYIGMMALFGGTWVWATIIQHEYGLKAPALDWSDNGFGRDWALYILLQVDFASVYNYGYLIAGYMARDTAEIIRFTSTVRAVEAAGGAVASGISSTHAPMGFDLFLYPATVGVNFGLCGLALVPTYIAVRTIGLKQSAPVIQEEVGKSDAASA